jgi:hypothetical protein
MRRCRGHTFFWMSIPLQQGLGFCVSKAHTASLPFRSLLVGCLLRLCGERRTVPPFCVSTLRDVRSVLYAEFRFERRLAFEWQTRPGTVPSWACLLSCGHIASVGRLSLTACPERSRRDAHHTFTCVDVGCAASAAACSTGSPRLARGLPPFRPTVCSRHSHSDD